MAGFFPNDPLTYISNGTIQEISSDNRNTLVTVVYTDRVNRRVTERTVRMVLGRNTTVLDENGRFIPASALTTGMMVNAVVSSAMTRSIPPQTTAFLVRIVSRARLW